MIDGESAPPAEQKPINTGKEWTGDEITYLMRAQHHGATIMEMAEFLQRDANEVDAKLDFFGV